MKAMGFSFPCPPLTSSSDEDFEWFYEIAQNKPSMIYNAFPQLARWENFRQARTQPLIWTRYLPTTFPNWYCESLEEALTDAHEMAHVMGYWTPAKIFARLLLSRAFDFLGVLLVGLTWDSEMEKSWKEVLKIIAQLTAICGDITLSEELRATALSFQVCAPYFSEEVEALCVKEKEIVAKTNLSPDFWDLYFHTFKKVEQWIAEERASSNPLEIVTYLEMFLQGIKTSRSPWAPRVMDGAECGLLVVDSTKRCSILAESVNAMRSGKDLYDWLIRRPSIKQEATTFLAAQHALAKLKDLSKERKCLWIPMNTEIRVDAVIYPQEFDRGWYITCEVRNDNNCQEEMEALFRVLELESLLEQLTSRNGICCPHYKPVEGCRCDPTWKESLNRIARWANEGKFDQGNFNRGNWKDLPQECRNKP